MSLKVRQTMSPSSTPLEWDANESYTPENGTQILVARASAGSTQLQSRQAH
jgi:hypothetical protein